MSTKTDKPNKNNCELHRTLKFNIKDRYNYDKDIEAGEKYLRQIYQFEYNQDWRKIKRKMLLHGQ